MKIIFNKYGGLKTIEDRQLLVQSSDNANYVDIYYQDDAGNFADETVNLATIAFKRSDTFEISERTCDAVREELTNKILYFRYVFLEDELAVNGELQITVRLKQVTFDPEDETQILLVKQKTMGKIVAHIYEAVGTELEEYNVIDGRLLRLELWQDTFDGTFYDVTQTDAKFAKEVNDRNQAIENHDESNISHDDIRQALANNASAISSETLSRQSADDALDERIEDLETFKNNLDTDITDEITQAVAVETNAREQAIEDLQDIYVKQTDATKVEVSETNGNIKVDNEEVVVYDDTDVLQKITDDIATHNTSETAHSDIRNAVAEAKAIAEGKARARVFATVTALDAWLAIPENVALLLVGDNFYIEETDKPDYWWNGTNKVKLETEKVDLTDYAKTIDLPTKVSDLENDSEFLTEDDLPTIPTIPDITVNNGSAESGKYISQVEVDGTNKHKLNITKQDLPQGFSGSYNDLTDKPNVYTKDEADKLFNEIIPIYQVFTNEIGDQLSDIMFDSSYPYRPYYAYNSTSGQLYAYNETNETWGIGFAPSRSRLYYTAKFGTLTVYLYNTTTSKLENIIPTIPTLSHDIATDIADTTKTVTPNAVGNYTYSRSAIDTMIGDIETLLEAL